MDKPSEHPTELSWKIAPREYMTVTYMGNWNAMRDDRDRWKRVAQALALQLGKVEYADAAYEDQEQVDA